MNIKARKSNPDGIVRVETSGSIKEILINEDFLNPKNASVQICFRGKSSSGIVEMTSKELEDLYRSVEPRLQALRSTKVMKFGK